MLYAGTRQDCDFTLKKQKQKQKKNKSSWSSVMGFRRDSGGRGEGQEQRSHLLKDSFPPTANKS